MNETLDLNTLLSYHKQEASEELAYITVIFTVILGILGYIGSAKKIEPLVRITISVIFSIFLFTFISALVSSLRIHHALHEEIRNYTVSHPGMFVDNEKSKLFTELSKPVKQHHPLGVIWMGTGLGIIVILGLLTLGEGKVFSFPGARKKYKQKDVN
ncbi:MAG: hypothetical protein IPP99_16395 [Chitinophagaceae bacterium]|nr:hypothetical protein [Chitinophagaceae bacterium]